MDKKKSELSKKQKKELRHYFDLFDKDKSGNLSLEELKSAIDSLEINVSDQELEQIISFLDKDKSGEVDFQEFCDGVGEYFFSYKPTQHDLYKAFHYYDENNSGFITEDELFRIMKRFKPEISINEVRIIINAADKNGDGKISFEEFVQKISS